MLHGDGDAGRGRRGLCYLSCVWAWWSWSWIDGTPCKVPSYFQGLLFIVLCSFPNPVPDPGEVLLYLGWIIGRWGVGGATEPGTSRGGWRWWCRRGLTTPWSVDEGVAGWCLCGWGGVGGAGGSVVGVRAGCVRHGYMHSESTSQWPGCCLQ